MMKTGSSTWKLTVWLIFLIINVIVVMLGIIKKDLVVVILGFVGFIISFATIIRLHFVNMRKITFMFDAIENSDYAFMFAENLPDTGDKMVNNALNRMKEIMVMAKKEVIEQERYYEHIINQVNTGIVVINTQGNVYQSNKEALRLTGLPRLTHVSQLATIDSELPQTFLSLNDGSRCQVKYTNERGTVNLTLNVSEIKFRINC